LSDKRILVVDNDDVTLLTVKAMLEGEGYEVRAAASALEANQHIYGDETPDLILLDVMMPFLDGVKKTAFLKEREKSRDIPVLLMSSKPKRELEELAKSSGADGCITKPITPGALLAAITRHL
jgi:CheY-like chemotaxis protein